MELGMRDKIAICVLMLVIGGVFVVITDSVLISALLTVGMVIFLAKAIEEYEATPTSRAASRRSGWSLSELRTEYSPYEFETLIASLLEAMGAQARTTRKSGDNGLDVLASTSDGRIGVQVKRYGASSTVGSPDIRDAYAGGVQADCQQVLVVTSGSFSSPAVQTAAELATRGRVDVDLIDGPQLVKLLNEYLGNQSPTRVSSRKQTQTSITVERH